MSKASLPDGGSDAAVLSNAAESSALIGLEQLRWNEGGLVAAIACESRTNEVLMLAWMNRESLALTIETGRAWYWSRSRKELWCKGETSGDIQLVHEVRVDCDGDALLILVDQKGRGACHTGRRSCFYRVLGNASSGPAADQALDLP